MRFAVVVAVVLSGLISAPAQDAVQLAVPFEIKPGQVVTVEDAALRISFEGVTQDSRCPVGVTCVWEGDAVVTLTLERPPASRDTRALHTSRRYARETTYEGFVVRLQDLKPKPATGQTISPEDYRATLVVEKG